MFGIEVVTLDPTRNGCPKLLDEYKDNHPAARAFKDRELTTISALDHNLAVSSPAWNTWLLFLLTHLRSSQPILSFDSDSIEYFITHERAAGCSSPIPSPVCRLPSPSLQDAPLHRYYEVLSERLTLKRSPL
ncbi:hypothetical protein HGRIS_014892 [Hohenbuehelia grisea]|uniref:Uncharacterized protein n=1 Tax=Hohenbuehelia grisea TaxID=104357 RepID=A0ABR3JSH3_9AGAR